MTNPAPYPVHGASPWDAILKAYIDAGDAQAESSASLDADVAAKVSTAGSATQTALQTLLDPRYLNQDDSDLDADIAEKVGLVGSATQTALETLLDPRYLNQDDSDLDTDVTELLNNGSSTTTAKLSSTYTGKQVPAYAGSRLGAFDGFVGYNHTAANMLRWRSLVGNVLASGGGDIAFIGDSLTAGSTLSNGTYQVAQSWPSFLRQLMQNDLPAGSCQDGMIRATSSSTATDSRWSVAGTWVNGTSFRYSTAVNSTGTLTTTNSATNVSIWYYDWADNSTFSITPGGGASAVTVTCSGPTAGVKRRDITGLATATNTVTVKQLTGADMGIIGGAIWSANTLLFHNIAQGGSTATGTSYSSWSDTVAASSPWNLYINPHNLALNSGQNDPTVIFVALGANDMKTQTVAATKAKVQQIINAYPSSDIVLVGTQPLNTTFFSDATWTSWVSALYDLADSLGIVALDLRNLVGNYAACVSQSYTVDGQGHFQGFANGILARAMAKALRI